MWDIFKRWLQYMKNEESLFLFLSFSVRCVHVWQTNCIIVRSLKSSTDNMEFVKSWCLVTLILWTYGLVPCWRQRFPDGKSSTPSSGPQSPWRWVWESAGSSATGAARRRSLAWKLRRNRWTRTPVTPTRIQITMLLLHGHFLLRRNESSAASATSGCSSRMYDRRFTPTWQAIIRMFEWAVRCVDSILLLIAKEAFGCPTNRLWWWWCSWHELLSKLCHAAAAAVAAAKPPWVKRAFYSVNYSSEVFPENSIPTIDVFLWIDL